MLIAHVFFSVSPGERDGALAALLAEVPAFREMAGCLAFVPFLDPTDPARLGVLHEWESEADFAAYTASSAFQEAGAKLRPMIVGAPVSRRYSASPVPA